MQTLDLAAKGLFTHPNPLGDVPPGGLLEADNVVIDKEGTTETRRGFKRYGIALTANPSKLFNYKGSLIVRYGSKMAYDSNNAGTWVEYAGSYVTPTGAVNIRSVEANKNFYFTSNAGVQKLDSLAGTIGLAGGIKGLDGTGTTTGATGFMANNSQVAYRIVWGITDANDNKVLGAPSQRIVVGNNSGGTRDVSLTFTIPAGITTTHFYQIYRSGQSGSITDEPNDELQLVVEKNPTAGEITAKSVTYTDSTPDNLRGATLYTSPSQQGILNSNEPPPLARDMTLYKDCVFYANTKTKQRLYLTLIAVGSPNGIQVNDTIVIAGTTYTGKATETASSGEFQVFTGGTVSENIDDTAQSLVRVINKYATNTTVYAYYLTGFNDLPGQLLIEERGIAGSAYAATSSRGGAFSPTLPSSGTTYSSNNESSPNKIYVSKQLQPEAVPLLNYLTVGSSDQDIVRVIALRDSVFVLKTDGIYRITGETFSDFRVALFDNTTTIKAEETGTAFNNQVFCFSLQGVAAISDSGVQIVSRPIEKTILQLASEQYTNFDATAFAIPYESDRKFLLFTVHDTTDTYATQGFIYNYVTTTWTRWPMDIGCGIVSERDNKLYLGSADPASKYVYQERKNYDLTDYADEELSVTVTSSTGTTVNVNSTTNVVAGMSLVQYNGTVPIRNSVIVTVNSITQLTVTDVLGWAAGPAKIYNPIPTRVTYAPIHGGNPATLKSFEELIMMFSNANFNYLTVSFTTDISISNDTVNVSPKSGGPWGLFPWGNVPWSGGVAYLQAIRTYFPAEKNMANWMNVTIEHSQAITAFAMVGIAIVFEEISTRRT